MQISSSQKVPSQLQATKIENGKNRSNAGSNHASNPKQPASTEMKELFPGLFNGQLSSSEVRSGSKAAYQLNQSIAPESEQARLQKAAREFQAIFIGQMLKAMRSNLHPEGGMLYGGNRQKIFEDMLYDEYAKHLSNSPEFNLADQIYQQLSPALPQTKQQHSSSNAQSKQSAKNGLQSDTTLKNQLLAGTTDHQTAPVNTQNGPQSWAVQKMRRELEMSRNRISTDQLRLDNQWHP